VASWRGYRAGGGSFSLAQKAQPYTARATGYRSGYISMHCSQSGVYMYPVDNKAVCQWHRTSRARMQGHQGQHP